MRPPSGIVEFYVRDCCNHAAETREIVRGVHRQKEAVVRQCRLLSGLQLTRIDKNVVYDDREFAKQQADHCTGVRRKVGHGGQSTRTRRIAVEKFLHVLTYDIGQSCFNKRYS